MTEKSLLRNVLPNRIKDALLVRSIRAAVREQGLSDLMDELAEIVPDISHQYTTFPLDSDYIKTKVRAMHAFQIHLVMQALAPMLTDNLNVVDIGDSSGTHIRYLKDLYRDYNMRFLSVNMDENAVNRIRSMNLEAVHCRAEELLEHSINADVFLSFEMLEHLMNPVKFLRDLSYETTCKSLVITVPFLSTSRMGLHHIRNGDKKRSTPENTHIFELSPSDLRLLFKHSGWSVISEKIYLQYPNKGVLRLMKGYWKKNDFEGFYGAILSRDHTWSQLYDGW